MRTQIIERPTASEFESAAARVAEVVVRTPLVPLHAPSHAPLHDHGADTHGADARIFLKPEILQPSGSFKIRGIYHAALRLGEEGRRRGLSTVSAGNTAKALAWCARRFGVPARSLMPESAPSTKVEAVRALGGTPVLVPTPEVFRFLREHGWEREPYSFIHPWTNRDVILGHGSLGLEILRDCPNVETVFVPVGGGGLLAGVGGAIKAMRPSVRVVAVEPAGCPSLHAAIRARKPVTVECQTMCDGVAVPYITDEMFPLLSSLADESVLITEDEVRAAIRTLASASHFVAEGAGALSTAAALKTPLEERGTTVCLVTGGSIDTRKLVEILGEAAPTARK
jgi:threonine dehydratase